MSDFWYWILLILVAVPVVVLWLYSVTDVLRRKDISGPVAVAWIVGIVAFPLVGAALYLVFRPSRSDDMRGFGSREVGRPRTRPPADSGDDRSSD